MYVRWACVSRRPSPNRMFIRSRSLTCSAIGRPSGGNLLSRLRTSPGRLGAGSYSARPFLRAHLTGLAGERDLRAGRAFRNEVEEVLEVTVAQRRRVGHRTAVRIQHVRAPRPELDGLAEQVPIEVDVLVGQMSPVGVQGQLAGLRGQRVLVEHPEQVHRLVREDRGLHPREPAHVVDGRTIAAGRHLVQRVVMTPPAPCQLWRSAKSAARPVPGYSMMTRSSGVVSGASMNSTRTCNCEPSGSSCW